VCSELTDDDVRTAIKNSGGIKGSLLIPEAPFELLVRRAIERLLPPALQCKDFVHGELLRIASQCAPPEVRRFQILGVSDTGAVGRLRPFQVLGVLQQKRGTVWEI
jgi:dynamin 1-like protein